MHYYKRNIGDYHKKAGRLTMLQHGAYTLLLDACYDREQFPTKNEAIDWLWASSKEELEAVDFVLSKFFREQEDGTFVQNRIKEEVGEYIAICETNAANGKKGGRPKNPKNKPKETHSVLEETHSVNLESETKANKSDPNPNHKPLTINHKTLTNNQDLKDSCQAKPNAIFSSNVNLALNKLSHEYGKSDITDKVFDDERKEFKSAQKSGATLADILSAVEIFSHWKKTFRKNQATKFTAKRIKSVTKALRDGYSSDQIKIAINGCASTPWNMGENPSGQVYDDLELICRDGGKIEKFSSRTIIFTPEQKREQEILDWINEED